MLLKPCQVVVKQKHPTVARRFGEVASAGSRVLAAPLLPKTMLNLLPSGLVFALLRTGRKELHVELVNSKGPSTLFRSTNLADVLCVMSADCPTMTVNAVMFPLTTVKIASTILMHAPVPMAPVVVLPSIFAICAAIPNQIVFVLNGALVLVKRLAGIAIKSSLIVTAALHAAPIVQQMCVIVAATAVLCIAMHVISKSVVVTDSHKWLETTCSKLVLLGSDPMRKPLYITNLLNSPHLGLLLMK